MFNRKLFVFLIVIIFILQISLVTAHDNNDVQINKTAKSQDFPELSANNHSLNTNHKSNATNHDNQMEFNQGDKIPIHINTPVEGNLTVFIDNKEYNTYNFTEHGTIYVPTYNPESFYNSSKMNIDIGLHNISLIFNFKYSCQYAADIFLDKNSTLNFKFHADYDFSLLNNTYIYTYNSTINILKKESTIHITKLIFKNLCQYGEYEIHVDNLKEEEFSFDSFGIIISNKHNILHKQIFPNIWADDKISIGLDTINNIGDYTFTVINLADGTTDKIVFKAKKYQPKLNITHNINGSNITIHIVNPEFNYFAHGIITINNITKEFIMLDDDDPLYNISFENLSAGIHKLKIYCPESSNAEPFYYETTFEIKYVQNNENNTSIIQNTTLPNNTTNITTITGNTTSNGTNSFNESGKNNNIFQNKNRNKNDIKSKEKIESALGNIKSSTSSEDLSNQKSYEISQKSTKKAINNPLTQIGIIIILIASLMMGYFKYEKKEM